PIGVGAVAERDRRGVQEVPAVVDGVHEGVDRAGAVADQADVLVDRTAAPAGRAYARAPLLAGEAGLAGRLLVQSHPDHRAIGAVLAVVGGVGAGRLDERRG